METSINPTMAINASSIQPRTAAPVAWRLCGTDFTSTPDITIQEALAQAGGDFNVNKQSLVKLPDDVIQRIQNGEPLTDLAISPSDIITSHMATVRTDNGQALGIVGRDYGVVQNQKAFEFISFLEEISGQKLTINNVGSLGYGERMYVSAKLGEDCYIDKDDAIENYVIFTNSHDGSGSVMAFFTPVRVWCQNSLNLAIAKCHNKVTFKHTKYVEHRIDWERQENRQKAAKVFAEGNLFTEKFIESMQALKEEKIDDLFRQDFCASLYLDPAKYKLYMQADRNLDAVDEISTRAKNIISRLNDAIESGVGQEVYRGSKLWLLNGITTFLHNNQTYQSTEHEFKSLMEGDGAKKVQKAYDFLIA